MATTEAMNGQEQPLQETTEYNGTHRLFMQSMLSHRILKESQAEEIYEKICDMLNGKSLEPTMDTHFISQLKNSRSISS
jgi:NADPH-dependent 7-cyano-7-deazaguanine reductase QueF